MARRRGDDDRRFDVVGSPIATRARRRGRATRARSSGDVDGVRGSVARGARARVARGDARVGVRDAARGGRRPGRTRRGGDADDERARSSARRRDGNRFRRRELGRATRRGVSGRRGEDRGGVRERVAGGRGEDVRRRANARGRAISAAGDGGGLVR